MNVIYELKMKWEDKKIPMNWDDTDLETKLLFARAVILEDVGDMLRYNHSSFVSDVVRNVDSALFRTHTSIQNKLTGIEQ